MAAELAKLVLKLSADSAELTNVLKASRAQVSDFGKHVSRVGEEAKDFLKGMLGIAALTAAAGGLRDLVKGAIDAADSMDELSQKVGMSTEELSKLSYAAKFSGVDTEGLAAGLRNLAKDATAAAAGGKSQAAVFESMGVAVKNADGSVRPLSALLADVAEKFAGYEDGAAKSALAQSLFGKAGSDLIPILNQGKAGLAKLGEEAERMGVVLSGETAKKAAEFSDTMDRIGAQSKASGKAIMEFLLPSLQSLADQFEKIGNSKGLDKYLSIMSTGLGAIGGGAAGAAAAALKQAEAARDFRMMADEAGSMLNWPAPKGTAPSVGGGDGPKVKRTRGGGVDDFSFGDVAFEMQAIAAIREWSSAISVARGAISDLATEQEKYAADVEALNLLFITGQINIIKYLDALDAAEEKHEKAITSRLATTTIKAITAPIDEAKKMGDDLIKRHMQALLSIAAQGSANIGRAIGAGIASGFEDGSKAIEDSFKDLLIRLAAQAAAAAAAAAIMKSGGGPVAGNIGGEATGGLVQGVLGAVFGRTASAGSFGPRAAPTSAALTAAPGVQRVLHSFDRQSMRVTLEGAMQRLYANTAANR